MDETPICCLCKEDFPVAAEPTGWRMGQMRSLNMAPRFIQDRFSDWLDDPIGSHLCGNCYFDLTDDE